MGKTQETRKKIIQSAIELAKKNGPDKVSVKQIYEAAGISKNTFYLYFNNKEEVFGNTYTMYDDVKMDSLPQILLKYDSPLEQYWEYSKFDIERQMSFGSKLLATIAFQNIMYHSFNIESEETLSPAINVSLSMIKKMQRTGEIANKSDAFLILKTLYDCVLGIDIRWSKTSGAFDFKKEIFNEMVMILQPKVEISNY